MVTKPPARTPGARLVNRSTSHPMDPRLVFLFLLGSGSLINGSDQRDEAVAFVFSVTASLNFPYTFNRQ